MTFAYHVALAMSMSKLTDSSPHTMHNAAAMSNLVHCIPCQQNALAMSIDSEERDKIA